MMFCRNCGKEVSDKAIICPSCGAHPLSGNNFCQNCAAKTDPLTEICVKCGVRLAKVSPKNKTVAGLLALFLGGIGIHKFYLGTWGWGLIYLFFCWTFIPAIVALIEAIRFFTLAPVDFESKVREAQGKPFRFVW